MLNAQLSVLGLPEEWRPPLYSKRPRPQHDSDLFIETDRALIEMLANEKSPQIDIWRAILRLWRSVKDYRIAAHEANRALQNGNRQTVARHPRPHYAFEIEGRRYQLRVDDNMDVEIVRHLGTGVTMVENHVRLNRMALSHVMMEALTDRSIGSVIEMTGIDQQEYGEAKIEHAFRRGGNTVLVIKDFPNTTPIFNFKPIEALLEKQDRDKAANA